MNENINHPIKYLILTEMQTNCTHHHDAKQSLLFFFLFCVFLVFCFFDNFNGMWVGSFPCRITKRLASLSLQEDNIDKN